MDGLKPFFPNKVFPVMVETEVSCLVPKPADKRNEQILLFGILKVKIYVKSFP